MVSVLMVEFKIHLTQAILSLVEVKIGKQLVKVGALNPKGLRLLQLHLL